MSAKIEPMLPIPRNLPTAKFQELRGYYYTKKISYSPYSLYEIVFLENGKVSGTSFIDLKTQKTYNSMSEWLNKLRPIKTSSELSQHLKKKDFFLTLKPVKKLSDLALSRHPIHENLETDPDDVISVSRSSSKNMSSFSRLPLLPEKQETLSQKSTSSYKWTYKVSCLLKSKVSKQIAILND